MAEHRSPGLELTVAFSTSLLDAEQLMRMMPVMFDPLSLLALLLLKCVYPFLLTITVGVCPLGLMQWCSSMCFTGLYDVESKFVVLRRVPMVPRWAVQPSLLPLTVLTIYAAASAKLDGLVTILRLILCRSPVVLLMVPSLVVSECGVLNLLLVILDKWFDRLVLDEPQLAECPGADMMNALSGLDIAALLGNAVLRQTCRRLSLRLSALRQLTPFALQSALRPCLTSLLPWTPCSCLILRLAPWLMCTKWHEVVNCPP